MSELRDRDSLDVRLQDGRLVVSIGVQILKVAAEHHPKLTEYCESTGEFIAPIVMKPTEFAQDVLTELWREEEDGTTLVHLCLDKAIERAAENGSEWIRTGGDAV